jgi:hypothetical protein
MRHAVGIVLAVGVVTVLSLLPFLPGRYDPLAAPLSRMAQAFGLAGLILVPCGALRLAAERLPRFARWRLPAAAIAVAATIPVWALVLAAATDRGGLVLPSVTLAACVYVNRRSWRTLREMRQRALARPHVMPLYLAAVPLGVAILQYALLDRAVSFSRDRAIRRAGRLIADIERHRAAHGHYPESLLAAWPDQYTPGLLGIERYQYEPRGGAYNVIFEQCSNRFGTRELVVYNPRDEQAFTAHASDVSSVVPGALEHRRGYYAVHDAAPHWKYFWFD